MDAHELARELLKTKPGTRVIIPTSNFELNYSKVKASLLLAYNGRFEKKKFKGAFDNTAFLSEVALITGPAKSLDTADLVLIN